MIMGRKGFLKGCPAGPRQTGGILLGARSMQMWHAELTLLGLLHGHSSVS